MKLSKTERLEYCKFCTNVRKDVGSEWLCKLTMQEPSFDCICYDYNEKELRSKDIKEKVDEEIGWYNESIDYSKLKWDELEPVKEEMFCPGEELIEPSYYLNSEIIAVPINDVRWWVIDKIPNIDLSKQLKIIIKNDRKSNNIFFWTLFGGLLLYCIVLFFFFSFFPKDSAFSYGLFSFVLMGFIGYIIEYFKHRPPYFCIEINRMDSLMKLPEENSRYIVPFEHVYFYILGGG